MTEMRFSVPGVPVAWARARTRDGRHFTAPKVKAWKDRVLTCALAAGVTPLRGPLHVSILAYWPCVGAPRKKTPRPRRYKTSRPDADNIAKGVCDALNGQAWADDAQVALLTVCKMHAAQGEPPRTEIAIASRPALPDATEMT